MKKEFMMPAICLVLFLLACCFFYYLLVVREVKYYTQIDNTKVEQLENGKYRYELRCYATNGEVKQIRFETSRELKEGAYLELDVMAFRGVVRWREVTIQDMPSIVREKYHSLVAERGNYPLFLSSEKTHIFCRNGIKKEKNPLY